MAITKKIDMPSIALEQPAMSSPVISTTPTGSGTNTEVISPMNTEVPYLNPSVESELSILQNLKNNQLDIDTSPAMKHLAGTKTRVIYFNQVQAAKNNDQLNITSPSAINATKYNRIENMLIITEGELAMSFNSDNGLVTNDITADGLIYPGSIHPYPNDLFFSFETMDECTLYRITSVEPIHEGSETGFKIAYQKHYEQFDPDNMTNLTAGYFVFNFESIGTGNQSVVEKKIYSIYKTVCELFKIISEEYADRFFDRGKNIIAYKYTPKPEEDQSKYIDASKQMISDTLTEITEPLHIFDPYMMQFLSKAFVKDKIQYKGYSIYPILPVWIDESFKETYKFTIYNAIVKRKSDFVKYPYFFPVRFQKRTLRDIMYDGWYYFEPVTVFGDKVIDIYPPLFINKIKTNTKYDKLYDNADYLKYNVLINFINIPKYVPTVEELEAFRDVELIPDSELYGVGPLIMYICSYYKDMLLRKTY